MWKGGWDPRACVENNKGKTPDVFYILIPFHSHFITIFTLQIYVTPFAPFLFNFLLEDLFVLQIFFSDIFYHLISLYNQHPTWWLLSNRSLAQKWHPDHYSGEEKKKAEKMFIDIAAAKEVLTDEGTCKSLVICKWSWVYILYHQLVTHNFCYTQRVFSGLVPLATTLNHRGIY